ncbi:MAG: hypothetical protein ACOYMG_08055, partial [Candidatus Methylumidiphilus sp.]
LQKYPLPKYHPLHTAIPSEAFAAVPGVVASHKTLATDLIARGVGWAEAWHQSRNAIGAIRASPHPTASKPLT